MRAALLAQPVVAQSNAGPHLEVTRGQFIQPALLLGKPMSQPLQPPVRLRGQPAPAIRNASGRYPHSAAISYVQPRAPWHCDPRRRSCRANSTACSGGRTSSSISSVPGSRVSRLRLVTIPALPAPAGAAAGEPAGLIGCIVEQDNRV